MSNYKFSFGYLALKMLGKTLYSNPFAALSELIANGFDANADKVWVYLDLRNKTNSSIVVIDNGGGMSDFVVLNKYLQVGKKNRPDDDTNMMGRKGIGKLAAFYLSNKYYLITKTEQEKNLYEIDFTKHEDGTKSEEDDTYMKKIESLSFPECTLYNKNITGTALFLTNVNFSGYGEKTFAVLEAELAELFCVKNKYIFLKMINEDDDINKEYILVQKKIAYKNMSKIYYNLDNFEEVLKLNGKEIEYVEKKEQDTKVFRNVEKYTKIPRASCVNGKTISISPIGWIGIHQTINRDIASKNDPENFINSKFYHFNKIRIYVRGKLALENILPYVHNTQYYVNYIEGELECNELDDNLFPDIASSSRQDIDKNDDRFIALLEYVKEIVHSLVKYKNEQTDKDLALRRKKQQSAVYNLSEDVKKTLDNKIGKSLDKKDIETINHSIINSFEKVNDIVKTSYTIFLSHRRGDNKVANFIYYYLTEIYGFDEEYLFYTSKPGGVDESIDILEQQINKSLTNENTYIVFCIESKKFKESEYCMFEGGAAWAVKQNYKIGLVYDDYQNNVPTYLKSLKNIKVCVSNEEIKRDTYIGIVNLLNSMIEYLNRNYVEQSNQKPLISKNLPTDVELTNRKETLEKYYNKDIIKYWNQYVRNREK